MRKNTMRKNNNSAGHDKPLTVPIEDLSEELFHFCFTPRILGLFNLNIKATYVNKAVDTAVTTAVGILQALFRKKNQSRDLNAAISLVKCNYVCLRFETLARKAEFAK